VALDVQQRTAQYGHRRHNACTETENGRVNSTAEPRSKRGDYLRKEFMGTFLKQLPTTAAMQALRISSKYAMKFSRGICH
jgi:hypothetical protein